MKARELAGKACMIMCGVCFMLLLLAGACLDSENWIPPLATCAVAALGCRGFYDLAVFIHDISE